MVNLQEGGRRMRTAGAIALKLGFGSALLNLVLMIVFRYTDVALHAGSLTVAANMLLTIAATWLIVPGAVLALGGWIVQGFGSAQGTQSANPESESIPQEN